VGDSIINAIDAANQFRFTYLSRRWICDEYA